MLEEILRQITVLEENNHRPMRVCLSEEARAQLIRECGSMPDDAEREASVQAAIRGEPEPPRRERPVPEWGEGEMVFGLPTQIITDAEVRVEADIVTLPDPLERLLRDLNILGRHCCEGER